MSILSVFLYVFSHPSIHLSTHPNTSNIVVSFGLSAVLGTKDVHLAAALREVPVQRDMVV